MEVMNPFCIQLTLLLSLFFGNIVFGILPVVLCKLAEHFSHSGDVWNRRIKWSTFLLFVGAGVFLSNSFIVLLPEANHEFALSKNHSHHDHAISHYLPNGTSDHNSGHHHHESFPIPEFIVLLGFFLAYILQEVVHIVLTKCNKISRKANDMRVSFCSCAKRHTECSRTFKDARPDQTLFGMEKQLLESQNITNSTTAATNILPESEMNPKSELLRSSILAQAIPNYGTVTNVTEPAVDNPLPVLTAPVLLAEERRHIREQNENACGQSKFLLGSLLIVIVLSLQYVLQGIHLVSHTETSNQWSYLLVACLQNVILTFSSGSYLVAGNTGFVYIVVIVVVLSTASPIGMIVAMVNKNAVDAMSHQAAGVVLANICGILVYVTFCNMLRKKNFGSVVGMVKFLAVILGAGIAVILQYVLRILN